MDEYMSVIVHLSSNCTLVIIPGIVLKLCAWGVRLFIYFYKIIMLVLTLTFWF
jgi:hypothetical protein